MRKNTMLAFGLAILFLGACAPPPSDAKQEADVQAHYAKAAPEVQEYVRWTARSFSRSGLWLNDDTFAALSPEAREKKTADLAALLEEAAYGRHLCRALAEARTLKDKRLVPGLMKVAAYQRGAHYDCRPKWMAVAALATQESADAVPLLISLVDHGNENTRMWARAALSRLTGQSFKDDKQAWAKWWQAQGHPPVDAKYLAPFAMPKK